MCCHIIKSFHNTSTSSSSSGSSSSSLSVLNGSSTNSGKYYILMQSSANITLESLLGVIVARLDVYGHEESRMLQSALGDGFLDQLTRLHPTQSAFGATNESDFYVKKVVRFIQDELQIEPAPVIS
jgi:hypothetical protein